MNRCKLTLRILIAVFAAIALLATAVEAKDRVVKTPKTVSGLLPGQSIKSAPIGDPNVGYVENALKYQDETSKIAPTRVGGQPLKKGPVNSILVEDFEASVPPAGWSEENMNTMFNWVSWTTLPYSGLAFAAVEYDSFLVPQDEFLISPSLNFATATTDLRVDFYWMMSYYWGVSPYDNYDLELWISTDGGATWPTKLWDENGEPVFENFTWAPKSVDLSGYVGQTDVKLRWRYVGLDGAQAGIDLVYINDDPAPVGRCCYGAGTCADMTEADCIALTGDWDGALNCAANPCPVPGVGDNCADPLKIFLPADMPYTDLSQFTCGRINDYSATCLDYYDSGEDIIYEITVTSAVTVDIELDPKGTTYSGFAIDAPAACPLDAGVSDCLAKSTNSGSTAHKILGLTLNPGTYVLMVDTWASPDCIPDFDLTITESAGPPAGISCESPLEITLGAADLPYTESALSNCGFGNAYSSTCMGSYDGGENHITKLVLTDAVMLDITLNPNGTTWTGMAIDNVCPLDAATGSCIGFVGTSSGTSKSLVGLNLAAGTYYIMVDTYPTPNCVPDFSLTFAGAAPPPVNDACANAIAIGDVAGLAWNTASGTHDGAGTCIGTTSPNIWYCYTAPMTGNATFSLCGSTFDTKLAIYDGCSCAPLGAQLACADDECGTASEVTIPVVSGQQYTVEVGGYSTYSGAGVLSVTTAVAPINDDCASVTPVVLTDGVMHTFTGDNTGAASDCEDFPGNNAWEAFTLTSCADVTLDYCGTTPAFGNAWLNLTTACPCDEFTASGAFDVTTCPDGNVTITWLALPAGTYYYPVLTEAGAVGPYTINVVANTVTAYCAADGFCDEFISNLKLGTINNSSSCGASYDDYTALSTDLTQHVGYTLTVTNGSPYTYDACGAWVDWDHDNCFSSAEAVTITGGPAVFTGTVTPPASALMGPTRLRVRIIYDATPEPCGTAEYGEVEDYTVNVVPLLPTALINPNPQYLYYKFAVVPIINTFSIGNLADERPVSDINLSSLTINGLTPATVNVVPSAAGFYGPVVVATLPLTTFLNPYGLLYDVNNLTFTAAWEFTDASTGSITDDVTIIGKSSPIPSQYIIPGGRDIVLPGDFNIDGHLSVSDAVTMVQYIFAGGTGPVNPLIGDANCSGNVTISDVVFIIQYIFNGGTAPCTVGN